MAIKYIENINLNRRVRERHKVGRGAPPRLWRPLTVIKPPLVPLLLLNDGRFRLGKSKNRQTQVEILNYISLYNIRHNDVLVS